MAEWETTISVEEIISMKSYIRGQIEWVRHDLASALTDIKTLKRKEMLLRSELRQLEVRMKGLVSGKSR